MKWIVLPFGKHEGKTLPQIAFKDPDWLFWALESNAFRRYGSALVAQAEEVGSKAQRVKIPNRYEAGSLVEYYMHPSGGKFANADIIDPSRRPHRGSTPTMRLPWFDLSVPRKLADYDKLGGGILSDIVKFYHFGGGCRMTRKRAEQFFDDPQNFVDTDD